MSRDPVPSAKVEQLADSYNELLALHKQQRATQAELIRWCVRVLRTPAEQSARYRRAEGFRASNEARKAHREDQAKALLYLEWLATALENQSIERN